MRTASWWIAGFVIVGSAAAEQPARLANDTYAPALRKLALIQRAFELRPRRRDEPLRYENITDIEIREIQLVAAKYVPKSIVNISPVVMGCPCEEGPQCTDQVYIVANGPSTSVGLQLSRVKNSWRIGVVQEWWLRYDALRARGSSMDWRAYESSETELFRELPQCVGELVPKTTSNPPEVKK